MAEQPFALKSGDLSLQTQFSEFDGIGELSIKGVLSASTLRVIRQAALKVAATCTNLGLVVDLRQAVVLLDNDSVPLRLGADAETDIEAARMSRYPIAVVTTPALETLFQAWAWEMAYEGLIRGAFTELAAAREWVRSRSGLRKKVDSV